MKKIVMLIVLVFLFVLAPVLAALNTTGAAGGWGKTYKLSALDKVEIKNLQGEKLGEIEDFVMDPQRGRIAFVIFSHAGMMGMGNKVKIIPYEFLSFDAQGKNFILDVSKDALTSTIEVKNLQGEKLGEFNDFVIDSRGRIPFAMLSHEAKIIAIPYTALSLGQTRNFFVLDANEEKLASAPAVGEKEDPIAQAKAEEIYRYFGQSPYWGAE